MGIKEQILEAGELLLREKGVAALTQPQVSIAANIKQSHLTYYFPTRASLLLAIAEFTVSNIMANVAGKLKIKTLQEQSLVAEISKIMVDGLPPRIFLGLIVAADTDPEIRKLLRKLIRYVRQEIKNLLKQLGFDSDTDSVRMFHATVIGLAVMHQAQLNSASSLDVRGGIAAILNVLAPKDKSI